MPSTELACTKDPAILAGLWFAHGGQVPLFVVVTVTTLGHTWVAPGCLTIWAQPWHWYWIVAAVVGGLRLLSGLSPWQPFPFPLTAGIAALVAQVTPNIGWWPC